MLELAITLPPRGSGAVMRVLHAELRAAIRDGRLKPGLRLPSTRILAESWGVSRNTVMGAYDLLPLTFAAVALIAEEKLDPTGRRLAQLVYWTPALQLLFGTMQVPGPGFIAPLFAAYLLHKLFRSMDVLTAQPAE